MKVVVKTKIFGKKGWQDKNIILPDFCASYIEKFNIEIIEYHAFNCMGVFLQRKEEPKVDVWSHTIYRPKVAGNIARGFKELFEGLEGVISPKVEPELSYEI